MDDQRMDGPVELRPVREEDLAVLEALTEDPRSTGEFTWFGFGDPTRYRRAWADNGLLGAEGGTLMVAAGPEALGFVTWWQRRHTRSSFAWALGIALRPGAQGRGHGTRAHRLLARYLFDHTTVHRLEAETEVGNIAEQRALEKAGFRREGIMRGCAWRDGAWRDGVAYSLLRTDPRP